MSANKNKLSLLLIIAVSISKAARLGQNPPKLQFNFLRNLLKKYDEYHVMYHVDISTQNFIGNDLQYLSTIPIGVSICNHGKTYKRRIKPQIFKPRVHIVIFLDPLNFSSYLRYYRNVSQKDVVIFLLRHPDVNVFDRNYWIMPHLERAGNVLVFDVDSNSNPELYQICFYCGPNSGQLVRAFNISEDAVEIPSKFLYPVVKKQMSADLLNIGYVSYYPFAYPSKNFSNKIEGMEIDLLETVSLQLNFSYKLEESPNYDVLFEKLQARELDFAIGGLALSNLRHKYVDFSDAFVHENILAWYQFFPKMSFFTMTFFKFLMPLPFVIWIGLFTVIIFTSLVVYVVLKIFEDTKFPNKEKLFITVSILL